MDSLGPGAAAVVVGASGGIGAALVEALLGDRDFAAVHALARGFADEAPSERLHHGRIDVIDEAGIAAAAARLVSSSAPLRLVIVASGLLHADGLQPEKTYRVLDAQAMMRSYQVNAVGPALIAKHLLPQMAQSGRTVFAALSARVASIGDNRTGGWHAYRASKAALNMILRNLALETARKTPQALCVGLHPGTVDTALSRPFQRGVAPERLFSPERAASQLLGVIDGLTEADNGRVLAWDGEIIPP